MTVGEVDWSTLQQAAVDAKLAHFAEHKYGGEGKAWALAQAELLSAFRAVLGGEA